MAKIKKVKAAVIGCGRIGAFTRKELFRTLPKSYFPLNHCAAVSVTPGVTLVAVCDTNLESARKAAAAYGVKTFYTDFKKMIIEQSPEIVTIATRTAGRTDIIHFAANHGVKGIFIEKPLATNLRDAKKSMRAVRENNVALGYGTSRRYMPVYRQAKKIVESGRFGTLVQIATSFGQTTLMWSHPHTIDLINFFANDAQIDYVQSSFEYNKKEVGKNKIDFDPVLDFGFIKFKNGLSGLITSIRARDVELSCEKGKLLISENGECLQSFSEKGESRKLKIKTGKSGIVVALAEIRDFISHNKKVSMSAEEMLKEQRILLALGCSGVAFGKKIRLSEVQDDFTITGRTGELYP